MAAVAPPGRTAGAAELRLSAGPRSARCGLFLDLLWWWSAGWSRYCSH